MREVFEFRVIEEFADRLFRDDEGKKLWTAGIPHIRLIMLSSDDPRLARVGELQESISSELELQTFFSGWDIRRYYTQTELNNAEAFELWPTRTFEPAGEECGTVYDESTACPYCGGGARQVSDLRLDLRKAPKSKDIARTIAGEVIVSQRMAQLLTDTDMKGFELRRVRHKARYEDDPLDPHQVPSGRELLKRAKAAGAPHTSWRYWVWVNRPENRALDEQAQKEYANMRRQKARKKGKPAPLWYQLIATSPVEIVSPTRVGIEPFDDDAKGEHRCPRGDTIGLNLLTELWISRRDFENSKCDITVTKQRVGLRSGLLRPEAKLLITPRLWRALEENGLQGYRVEVAHLV